MSSFSATKSAALVKYEGFVEAGRNKKKPWTDLKQKIYVGSDDFISKVANHVDTKIDLTDIPSTHVPVRTKSLRIEEFK